MSASRDHGSSPGRPSPTDVDDPPLAGIRVVDLTTVLAGPYCTYQLGLLGAEIIKVEVPGHGDPARRLGADEQLSDELLGASFLAQNAGKKSVEIDLKTPVGHEAFVELVSGADVLVENFRPGVLARLGFPWERLQEINRSLIYCSISGFGHTGPMSERKAYDQIIQGVSGMMSVTGTPDTAPLRVGFPLCDTFGGQAAALAVSAALAGRNRSGRAVRIDLSLLECAVSAMGWVVSNFLITGLVPEPMGNDNFTAAPSGTFRTGSGLLNIAANQQAQFESLCHVLNRDDLISDPRFNSASARRAHRPDLQRELEGALRHRSATDWEDSLAVAGVPAARVLSIPEVAALEQLAARGFFQTVPFPGDPTRTVTVVAGSAHFNGKPLRPSAPPPLLGQHTREVLRSLRDVAEAMEIRSARRGDLIPEPPAVEPTT